MQEFIPLQSIEKVFTEFNFNLNISQVGDSGVVSFVGCFTPVRGGGGRAKGGE